jgi:hypothetical protein
VQTDASRAQGLWAAGRNAWQSNMKDLGHSVWYEFGYNVAATVLPPQTAVLFTSEITPSVNSSPDFVGGHQPHLISNGADIGFRDNLT